MENQGSKIEQLVELARPSLVYKDSFLEAVKEFKEEGKSIYMHSSIDLDALEKDFENFLSQIAGKEKGVGLPEGWVPSSELWLVEGNKFIGWTKIRHKLNEALLKLGGNIGYAIRPSERNKGYGTKILALASLKARDLGIDKILVTCDDDNTGSAKIIEKNGGVLENKIEIDGGLKRRYWIR
ncbi:MAG: GNAT family N-acetyltransferase [Candidatus Parcubacteria bacterium]|nr:GNAT family N-acetyltransferase [Candidatus Parcubacteria bacterium]